MKPRDVVRFRADCAPVVKGDALAWIGEVRSTTTTDVVVKWAHLKKPRAESPAVLEVALLAEERQGGPL